jgi:hypothetical protein
MAALPGVLGCRPLRRTVQVRLGTNNPAVARWHAHLRGLATVIHEISWLVSSMSVTTGGERKRMGGPQVPVPRLT